MAALNAIGKTSLSAFHHSNRSMSAIAGCYNSLESVHKRLMIGSVSSVILAEDFAIPAIDKIHAIATHNIL